MFGIPTCCFWPTLILNSMGGRWTRAFKEKCVSTLLRHSVWNLQTYQGKAQRPDPTEEPHCSVHQGHTPLREGPPGGVNTFISDLFSTPGWPEERLWNRTSSPLVFCAALQLLHSPYPPALAPQLSPVCGFLPRTVTSALEWSVCLATSISFNYCFFFM